MSSLKLKSRQFHVIRNRANGQKSVTHLPRGLLRISSDRDDRRIFGGFEIFDLGIFLGRKILANNFLG